MIDEVLDQRPHARDGLPRAQVRVGDLNDAERPRIERKRDAAAVALDRKAGEHGRPV